MHVVHCYLLVRQPLLSAPGARRNGPEDTPICVILQNTLEEFLHDGIINPKDISSIATPTIPLAA